MRLNKYIAQATGMSRRAADRAIAEGHIKVNEKVADIGMPVTEADLITHSGDRLHLPTKTQTIILNKPVGYVCSRDGQGSKTIYQLIPEELHNLKAVGRLDKDSSGLLLLTNDGDLAHKLTHPKFEKEKIYEITLRRVLEQYEQDAIKTGVLLEDGPSILRIKQLGTDPKKWQVRMQEGRNRQIRRTFTALNHTLESLHRIQFGDYTLANVPAGKFKQTTEL